MSEIQNGYPPTEQELEVAPGIERWKMTDQTRMRCDDGSVSIEGYFYRHPDIEDGERAMSSHILRIDAEEPPRWAQSENRLYRLGRPMGEVEHQVRQMSAEGWVAVVRKLPSTQDLKEYRDLFTSPPQKIDDVERLLLILVRTGKVGQNEARNLQRRFQTEIGS